MHVLLYMGNFKMADKETNANPNIKPLETRYPKPFWTSHHNPFHTPTFQNPPKP